MCGLGIILSPLCVSVKKVIRLSYNIQRSVLHLGCRENELLGCSTRLISIVSHQQMDIQAPTVDFFLNVEMKLKIILVKR